MEQQVVNYIVGVAAFLAVSVMAYAITEFLKSVKSLKTVVQELKIEYVRLSSQYSHITINCRDKHLSIDQKFFDSEKRFEKVDDRLDDIEKKQVMLIEKTKKL